MNRPESLPPDLVERLRRREPAAFEACYLRFKDAVYRMAARLLGDAQEAEDALHDVFLILWEDLPRFRGDSDLGTWIHRVTVNH